MDNTILIVISALILIAYIFDFSAARTKIPSVLLLMIVGWGAGRGVDFLGIRIPALDPILPVIGTIGLILIVLEGALDLKLTRSKRGLITKSFVIAFLGITIFTYVISYVIHQTFGYPLIQCVINVIPFSVISSAIAIPTVKHLHHSQKEFVVYESSFSDVIGIVIFNNLVFNSLNESILLRFASQTFIMLLISLLVTFLLFYLLSKIKHSIKFTPIIFSIILIYSISKTYHLPALILVFVFGLFLNNIFQSKMAKFLRKFDEKVITKEIGRFKEIVGEGSFIIRALFFILFGFLIQTPELLDVKALFFALIIVFVTYIIRMILLLIFRINLLPILFVAPRGLISILLFLMIPDALVLPFVNKSLVIQTILFTTFIMMFGMMMLEKNKVEVKELE